MQDLITERLNYPTVTEIIGIITAKEFAMIAPEVLKNAQERGSAVHEYCASYAQGLWVPDVEEQYKPYFDSFCKWWDKNGKKIIRSEERLHDDTLKFSGKFDMLIELVDGRRAIIDLKTSATSSKSWIVQLAAYSSLLGFQSEEGVLHINLKLKKTSCCAKEISYDADQISEAWDIFKGILKAYYYLCSKPVKAEKDND